MKNGELLFMFCFAVIVLSIGVWMQFFAPCDKLGWVSLKDLPARCLNK